ncbi:hypothetical protein AB0K60_15340 [Thermopolyspora sp. NPDC052614]|uniref:hypothetical protein n=1 Tax=Thermopolyspora sp. NPDC052614 TaxID=3155682 RepID=UPI00342C418D
MSIKTPPNPVACDGGPADRFVVTMGSRMLAITQSGDVWGHQGTGDTVGSAGADPFGRGPRPSLVPIWDRVW